MVLLTASDAIVNLTFGAVVRKVWREALQHLQHVVLRHRTQHTRESLPVVAGDIDRLTRKAFPSCPEGTVDMIAVASFTDAIQHPEAQRLLHLARPPTLREDLARALQIVSQPSQP